MPSDPYSMLHEAWERIAELQSEVDRLGRCNEQISRSHAEVINKQRVEYEELKRERDEARAKLEDK